MGTFRPPEVLPDSLLLVFEVCKWKHICWETTLICTGEAVGKKSFYLFSLHDENAVVPCEV